LSLASSSCRLRILTRLKWHEDLAEYHLAFVRWPVANVKMIPVTCFPFGKEIVKGYRADGYAVKI